MKTRIIIIVAAVCGMAVLFTSCKGCSNKRAADGGSVYDLPELSEGFYAGDEVNVRDSLNLSLDAGEVLAETFSGKVPAADGPGIVQELSLIHYSMLDNGVYKLKSTYVDAYGAGQDAAFFSYGRYNTFVGITGDATARYIRLTQFKGAEEMNFVFEDNGSLTMLDQSKARIESEHNYTLTKN